MANRFRFYEAPGGKVICVSTFAGKTVRGVATCAENDTYDFEKGKELAQLRVEDKLAQKRVAATRRRLSEAAERLSREKKFFSNRQDAYEKAVLLQDEARKKLNEAVARYFP